jgi:hypothetical protein
MTNDKFQKELLSALLKSASIADQNSQTVMAALELLAFRIEKLTIALAENPK